MLEHVKECKKLIRCQFNPGRELLPIAILLVLFIALQKKKWYGRPLCYVFCTELDPQNR